MPDNNYEKLLLGEFSALVSEYENQLTTEIGKQLMTGRSNFPQVVRDLAEMSCRYGALRSEAWINNAKLQEIKVKVESRYAR